MYVRKPRTSRDRNTAPMYSRASNPEGNNGADQSNIPQTMDCQQLCMYRHSEGRHVTERTDRPASGKEDPLSARWMTNDKVLCKRTPAMCRRSRNDLQRRSSKGSVRIAVEL